MDLTTGGDTEHQWVRGKALSQAKRQGGPWKRLSHRMALNYRYCQRGRGMGPLYPCTPTSGRAGQDPSITEQVKAT